MLETEVIKQCSIVLTRDCNLRCNFCFAKDAGYSKDDLISLKNLKKIIDFCYNAKIKYIFFTGGEPLLYPYFLEILSYIKNQKFPLVTAVASNGIILKDLDFCKKLIDHGLDYIDISMKGYDTQEWIEKTGYDGYLQQQEAIKNLSSLPIEFTCSMVITSENIFSICDSVKNALKNGAKQFSFTFLIDNKINSIKEGKAYLESHNPLKLIESFISQIHQLNSITNNWWIEYSFPMCIYTEKQLSLLKGKLASPCQIHKKNSITFDTNLNLLPCDMYFNNKIGKLGQDFVTIEDFKKFKNMKLYKDTIENISHLPSDECKDCKYLKKCYGGCPVLWKNYSFEDLKLLKSSYK